MPYRTKTSEEEKELEESVLWDHGGISILPHGNFPVLETLTRILLARAEHDRFLALLQAHLARPEDPKVWQSLLRFLVYLRPTLPEELTEFLGSLFERYPSILETREAAFLLAHAHWTMPDFVRSILSRWRTSRRLLIQQTYGEVVGLVAIVQPKLAWPTELLGELMASDELKQARVGAAYSAVNLWNEPGRRAACSQLLRTLIPEADGRTWAAIFDLFRLIDDVTPETD